MEYEAALERARKLMERATHPGTPDHEAAACQEKANKIMVDYAIAQADLDATRPAADRMKPETLDITVCGPNSPFKHQLHKLLNHLMWFTRTTGCTYGMRYNDGITARVVGYKSDLRYFEMLYTTLFLHLHSEAEPKPDSGKSFDENVYILHEAGVSYRKMVHALMPEIPHWDEKEIRKGGGRCKSAYRRWCKKIGEEPRGISSPVTYQRNFAEGYVERINRRLWDIKMREPRSNALVLRSEAVQEMFAELFPDAKPLPKSQQQKLRSNWEARSTGSAAADRADLGGDRVGGSTKPELN